MDALEAGSQPQPAAAPLLRQLPRKRIDKFVWTVVDTAWLFLVVAVAVLSLAWSTNGFRISPLSYFDAIILTASLYIAGLKLHSRIAGVSAALLIATNLPILALVGTHPQMGLIVGLLAVLEATYSLGNLNTNYWIGIPLVGLMFLGYEARILSTLALITGAWNIPGDSKKLKIFRRVVYCFLLYVAFQGDSPHSINLIPYLDLSNPIIGTAFRSNLWWFLIPFLPEVVNPVTRSRWIMPLIVIIFICLLPAVQSWVTEPIFAAAIPLLTVMVAVGLGRLIPLIAGEYQKPWMRYLAATLAVAGALSMQAFAWCDFR